MTCDGDFTRLALRLREAGKKVIGCGTAQPSTALVRACSEYTQITHLASPRQTECSEWLMLLQSAVHNSAKEDGWALLSDIGTQLLRLQPAYRTLYNISGKLLSHVQQHDMVETRVLAGEVVHIRFIDDLCCE